MENPEGARERPSKGLGSRQRWTAKQPVFPSENDLDEHGFCSQDWLHDLWGPLQKEKTRPLKKLIQSFEMAITGPSVIAASHLCSRPCLYRPRVGKRWVCLLDCSGRNTFPGASTG